MINKFTLIFLSLILLSGCQIIVKGDSYIYDKMDNIKVEESINWGYNGKEFIIKRTK